MWPTEGRSNVPLPCKPAPPGAQKEHTLSGRGCVDVSVQGEIYKGG